ncbi:MAG: methyltransferase domain-containing protein [Alphaproteobacteria bacterium]|nr:methyltransferase domain-containing protein [Alphaproteobacteria bacterium]
MSLDVADLREFYISPLGRLVRRLLREKLALIWPDLRGESVLALGYGTPLLRPWLGTVEQVLAMMPDAQGVAYWPREGPNVACLADLRNLPLPDASVNRIILLHALETALDPDAVLDEVWRILKPNGQALVIVPNRRGLWAHSEATPFGAGQPYSKTQLKSLLRKQGFLTERSWYALFMPPLVSRLSMALASLFEKYGPRVCPAFGGVLVMEASKQIYAPTMVKARTVGRRLILPMPFPSSPVPTNRSS